MSTLYHLYTISFPEYPVSGARFAKMTDRAEKIITRTLDQHVVGFAVLNKENITLLCVDPDYRKRGVGSSLLAEAEQEIAGNGSKKITLGCGNGYILQGVPEEHPEAAAFFQKRGYTADWSSINMRLDLSSFDIHNLQIPPCPSDVVFRLACENDMPAVLDAVRDVNENWLQYYRQPSGPVVVAEQNGSIVGFEILSAGNSCFTADGEIVGSVGCVGVIHSAREQGIGLRMAAAGLEHLKEMGCTSAELLYTWLADWYGKLGFETMHTQWMGYKEI